MLNIPRALRSKGKHISDSFPTLSIKFASMYILSTYLCPIDISTLPSDRRDILVEFLFCYCNVSIYVSIIMNNNSLTVRYCKSIFVIILSSELYLNCDAIIFTTALTGKEYSGKTNLYVS